MISYWTLLKLRTSITQDTIKRMNREATKWKITYLLYIICSCIHTHTYTEGAKHVYTF